MEREGKGERETEREREREREREGGGEREILRFRSTPESVVSIVTFWHSSLPLVNQYINKHFQSVISSLFPSNSSLSLSHFFSHILSLSLSLSLISFFQPAPFQCKAKLMLQEENEIANFFFVYLLVGFHFKFCSLKIKDISSNTHTQTELRNLNIM